MRRYEGFLLLYLIKISFYLIQISYRVNLGNKSSSRDY